MFKRNRVIGLVASSVAALGLVTLAATSASATGSSGKTAEDAQAGKGKPAAVAVQKTDDGLKVRALTKEEIENIEGAQPTGVTKSDKSAKAGGFEQANDSAKAPKSGKTAKGSGELPELPEMPEGIAVKKTKDGLATKKLSKEEIENIEGAQPTEVTKSAK